MPVFGLRFWFYLECAWIIDSKPSLAVQETMRARAGNAERVFDLEVSRIMVRVVGVHCHNETSLGGIFHHIYRASKRLICSYLCVSILLSDM